MDLLMPPYKFYSSSMMIGMRTTIAACATVFLFSSARPNDLVAQREATPAPQFTSDGKLKLPRDYRRWTYVSTGFGMSYSESSDHSEPVFDNVFVQREAYDHFVRTRTWPDRMMFILELRQSTDH